MSTTTRALSALILCGLAALPFGCGNSIDDACSRECDCDGKCSQRDQNQCVNQYDSQEAAAERAGCDTQFGDLLDCTASATCAASRFGTLCAAENDAYTRCMERRRGGISTGSFFPPGSGAGGSAAVTTGSNGSGGRTSGGSSGSGGRTSGGSGGSTSSGTGTTACQSGWDHYLSCQGDPPSPYPGTCTGSDACETKCFEGRPCDLWTTGGTPSELQSFDDCVNSCGV